MQIRAHRRDHDRVVQQPDHAPVAVWIGLERRIFGILGEKPVRLQDVERRERGLKGQHQDQIGIERDRRDQCLQFLVRERSLDRGLIDRWSFLRCGGRLRCRFGRLLRLRFK